MYCIKCGEKLVEGAKFCHQCGAKQSLSTTKAYPPLKEDLAQPQLDGPQSIEETMQSTQDLVDLLNQVDQRINTDISRHESTNTEDDPDFIGPKDKKDPIVKSPYSTQPVKKQPASPSPSPDLDRKERDQGEKKEALVEDSPSFLDKAKRAWHKFIHEEDDQYSIFSALNKKEDSDQKASRAQEIVDGEKVPMTSLEQKVSPESLDYTQESILLEELLQEEEAKWEKQKEQRRQEKLNQARLEKLSQKNFAKEGVPSPKKDQEKLEKPQAKEEKTKSEKLVFEPDKAQTKDRLGQVKDYFGFKKGESLKSYLGLDKKRPDKEKKPLKEESAPLKSSEKGQDKASLEDPSSSKKDSRPLSSLNLPKLKGSSFFKKKAAPKGDQEDEFSRPNPHEGQGDLVKEKAQEDLDEGKENPPLTKEDKDPKKEKLDAYMVRVNHSITDLLQKIHDLGPHAKRVLLGAGLVFCLLPLVLVGGARPGLSLVFGLVKLVSTLFIFYTAHRIAYGSVEETIPENLRQIGVLSNWALCQLLLFVAFLFYPREATLGYNILGAVTPNGIGTILVYLVTILFASGLFWQRLKEGSRVQFAGWYGVTFISLDLIAKIIWIVLNFLTSLV